MFGSGFPISEIPPQANSVILTYLDLLSGLLDEDFLLDDFESLLFFLAGLLDLDLDLDLEDFEPDFDRRLLRRSLRDRDLDRDLDRDRDLDLENKFGHNFFLSLIYTHYEI